MLYAALDEAAQRGELILVDNGLCRYHRRRDGRVTIREIIVLPGARRLGIGRRMVEEVQHRNPGATLVARCPVKAESGNAFWCALGFVQAPTTKDGLNTWVRNPG